MSEKLGTLHQYCRAANELTDVLIQLERVKEAEQLLNTILEIAQTNGYKPVLARTFLLKALATPKTEDKLAHLFTAFYLASEIGLSSLSAEIAFFIGTFELEIGNYIAGQEYLKQERFAARLHCGRNSHALPEKSISLRLFAVAQAPFSKI